MSNKINGGEGGGRTHTFLRTPDFESEQEVLKGIIDPDLRRFVADYLAQELASPGGDSYMGSYNSKDVVEIRLSKGQIAIIDREDAQKVPSIAWRLIEKDGFSYVRGHLPRSGKRGKQVTLHRVVMGVGPGVRVDHINGNTLDNRRSCNLRVATNAQNIRNSGKYRKGVGASSQFKGVSKQKDGKFRAQIMCSGKKINLGSFANEKAAAFAYDFNARKLFGEFARPNFGKLERPA